jgi:hypothetical protein
LVQLWKQRIGKDILVISGKWQIFYKKNNMMKKKITGYFILLFISISTEILSL